MKHYLIEKGCIPQDKSWIMRMGVLDLLNDYDDIIKFLEGQEELGDDLQAFHRALINWKNNEPVDIGESGTGYRFLRFASWKRGEDKKFIKRGTLKEREICDNPEIVDYSLEELLKLDNGTSQWASASVLLGNEEVIDNPPFKLKLTYEAVKHWNEKRNNGECWEERYDETILRQAEAYLNFLNTGKTDFYAEQTEDYCFARAFGFITKEEGESRWPSLHSHESDRILEMERALGDNDVGKEINSKDHRVVQAVAMLQKVGNKPIKIKHPSVVNKSWPQFWKFLEDSQSL